MNMGELYDRWVVKGERIAGQSVEVLARQIRELLQEYPRDFHLPEGWTPEDLAERLIEYERQHMRQHCVSLGPLLE